MRTKAKRGGCLGNLVVLVLLTGLAFGYVMYRYDESPSQAWRRIVDYAGQFVHPKPAPESPVTPSATPAPTPAPTPLAVPVATPVPEPVAMPSPPPVPTATPKPVDPVAWLISNKSRWPRELVLLETVEFPAVHDGTVAGSIRAPISSKVSVSGILAEDVDVAFMGAKRRLPHRATNLVSVAKAEMNKADAESSQSGQPVDQARIGERPIGDLPKNIAAMDAWAAAGLMTPGFNIGNTFDNPVKWETGWGSPLITKEYIQSLARLGFKSIRLPVAWDTFADHGRITPQQFQRIDEVVNWILEASMFCVINIHWDGGWIDSDVSERFPDTYHTFSPEAEKKFRSYWEQIARHFAARNEKLVFEGFNEESNFENEGSMEKAYATLIRVNQLFIDTVRKTGGNNGHRFLIVPGYMTDVDKTCQKEYRLPKDTVPGKLFVSVHYYTPWTFVGMKEGANWGKMQPTWGSEDDVKKLNELFDRLKEFCDRTNTPVYLGEFSLCSNREKDSRVRWTTSVYQAALKRKMVPVLWDIGGAVSRTEPYAPTDELAEMLRSTKNTRREP